MESSLYYGQNMIDGVDVVAGAPDNSGTFIFYTDSAIAAAEPSTSSVPLLYNPPASGVVARIMQVKYGAVAGTVIAGCLRYGLQASPTLSGLTAGPDAINGFFGRGNTTPLLWYKVATIGAAPSLVFANGISSGGAYAAGPLFTMVDNVNGSIVVPPGAAFWPFLAKNSVAMTALVTVFVVQTPMLATY